MEVHSEKQRRGGWESGDKMGMGGLSLVLNRRLHENQAVHIKKKKLYGEIDFFHKQESFSSL